MRSKSNSLEQESRFRQDGAVVSKNDQVEVRGKRSRLLPVRESSRSVRDQKILAIVRKRRDVVVELGPEYGNANYLVSTAILRIHERRPGIQSLIVAAGTDQVQRISRGLSQALRDSSSTAEVIEIGSAEGARKEAVEISRQPDIVVSTNDRVIDHLRRGQLDLSRLTLLVIEEPEERGGFSVDIEFIRSKLRSRPQIVIFSAKLDGQEVTYRFLKHPVLLPYASWFQADERAPVRSEPGESAGARREEEHVNEQRSERPQVDVDGIKEQIADIIRRIHEDENPEDLNIYRALFRRNVPFFSRGYFAAYLLKYGLTDRPRPAKSEKTRNGFASVFIGIGKNRRVFPRDLVQLLSGLDGVTADDIGEIKILDNYSFVEISLARAQAVIDLLNGKDFRGRRLNVNYARKKD